MDFTYLRNYLLYLYALQIKLKRRMLYLMDSTCINWTYFVWCLFLKWLTHEHLTYSLMYLVAPVCLYVISDWLLTLLCSILFELSQANIRLIYLLVEGHIGQVYVFLLAIFWQHHAIPRWADYVVVYCFLIMNFFLLIKKNWVNLFLLFLTIILVITIYLSVFGYKIHSGKLILSCLEYFFLNFFFLIMCFW
jgi:hypothetical protein